MSEIRNIWEEVNVDLNNNKTTPLDILQKQSKAINDESEKTNIVSAVMSFSLAEENEVSEIKHKMYLFPKNGNGYNYRFIEISSKPELEYPVTVYAYQTGNIHFGECKTEEEFYSALFKIFKDARLKVVFEQLKNIGNTIEDWKTEED